MYAAFKNVSICSLLKTKIKYVLIICLLDAGRLLGKSTRRKNLHCRTNRAARGSKILAPISHIKTKNPPPVFGGGSDQITCSCSECTRP